jgi:hypothetical protein
MVEVFEGPIRIGKTASVVKLAWEEKQKGRRVFTNFPTRDLRTKRRNYWAMGPGNWLPTNPRTFGRSWADGQLNTLSEVLALDNCLVVIDEASVWCDANDWQKLPWDFKHYLRQSGKRGMDIWCTAQCFSHVDGQIRSLTSILWAVDRYINQIWMRGRDPVKKERSYGTKRFVLGPEVWELYSTEYEVGSADGKREGRMARNNRYHTDDKTMLLRSFVDGLAKYHRVPVALAADLWVEKRGQVEALEKPIPSGLLWSLAGLVYGSARERHLSRNGQVKELDPCA